MFALQVGITVSPDEAALAVEGRANAVEAVALVVVARIAVLLVHVRRALAGDSVADLGQVALVRRFAAQVALLAQLYSFKTNLLFISCREMRSKWRHER